MAAAGGCAQYRLLHMINASAGEKLRNKCQTGSGVGREPRGVGRGVRAVAAWLGAAGGRPCAPGQGRRDSGPRGLARVYYASVSQLNGRHYFLFIRPSSSG